jgi:hypothetical protein
MKGESDMGYDVQQDLADHDVVVESHGLTDKDGDGSNIVINIRVRFKNGEIGSKDLYPCASDKALQIARKSLKAMGFDIDKRDIGELEENHALLAGAPVRVVVEEHEYNGKVTNRISWVNPIPKPAPKSSLADLTKRLRNAKNDNASEAL